MLTSITSMSLALFYLRYVTVYLTKLPRRLSNLKSNYFMRYVTDERLQ